MKTELNSPYLQFSNINTAQQLALCGSVAMFSEALGDYALRMSEATLDGIPFPGAVPIYEALGTIIEKPYGLRVHLFETIAREHDRKEVYAPLAWHNIYVGCRVLCAMAAAPLGKPYVLRENLELLASISPKYADRIVVVPHHLFPFPSGIDGGWIIAASGEEPAVRLLPELVPPYVSNL